MHIEDFIEAAKAYNDLGWAVQSQIDDLLLFSVNYDSLGPGDLNYNALEMIENFAASLPHDVDADDLLEAIHEYTILEQESMKI